MEAFGEMFLAAAMAVSFAAILVLTAAGYKLFNAQQDDFEDKRGRFVWFSILATVVSLTLFISLIASFFVGMRYAVPTSFFKACSIVGLLSTAIALLCGFRAIGPGRTPSRLAAVLMLLVWTPVMIVILNPR